MNGPDFTRQSPSHPSMYAVSVWSTTRCVTSRLGPSEYTAVT